MAEPSQRRIDANRRNALRSTGPRTPEGKARSRLNGLKHGLAAEVVVPEGDRAAHEATLARWNHHAGPGNVVEEHLVRRAAVAALTLSRIDAAREDCRGDAARAAVAAWEKKKRAAARRKGQLLGIDPVNALADLEASAFGCDWLIRRWRALDAALGLGGVWDATTLVRVQGLLGYPDGVPGAGADPELRRLWRLAAVLAPHRVPAPPAAEGEAAEPDDPDAARVALRDFVAEQVERLEVMQAEAWEAVEGPEHAAVVRHALAADTSKEGQLRHRYEVAADRSHNAAMRLFLHARGLRHRELLAIAKEARQSGKLPRAPVGGGWWREVDSDPAPPGFERIDPPGPAVAEVPAAESAASTPPAIAAAPLPEVAAEASIPADHPPSAAVTPTGAVGPRPVEPPVAPRRSEPNEAAVSTPELRRNPNQANELRNETPGVRPGGARRTEPPPSPPRPADRSPIGPAERPVRRPDRHPMPACPDRRPSDPGVMPDCVES